jgi:hypothetical protein
MTYVLLLHWAVTWGLRRGGPRALVVDATTLQCILGVVSDPSYLDAVVSHISHVLCKSISGKRGRERRVSALVHSGAITPPAHEAGSAQHVTTVLRRTGLYPSPLSHLHLDMRASGNAWSSWGRRTISNYVYQCP